MTGGFVLWFLADNADKGYLYLLASLHLHHRPALAWWLGLPSLVVLALALVLALLPGDASNHSVSKIIPAFCHRLPLSVKLSTLSHVASVVEEDARIAKPTPEPSSLIRTDIRGKTGRDYCANIRRGPESAFLGGLIKPVAALRSIIRVG